MRTPFYITLMLTACLMTGCGGNTTDKKSGTTDSTAVPAPGDKTIYGMACDGCNDTIVIFLPTSYNGEYDGSNPDTLNILEATRQHKVFGKIRIGDELAMIRNTKDSTVADLLIVTEDILGSWCYKVLPELHKTADMEGMPEDSIIAHLPDSLAQLLTVEREYGFAIKADNEAMPIGMRYGGKTSDEQSEVVYPAVKRYMKWHIYNGQFILSEVRMDSLGHQNKITNDTANFIKLTTDTLVLQFNDEERGFYKKKE